MKRKRVIGLMAAVALAAGAFGSTPVYAKSIWDLPGAPERTEGSDEEVERYFRNLEELETLRESITKEDTFTEEAKNDLLTNGPGSVYARASGDTPGYWKNKTMYWLENEGRFARNEWIKSGGKWYYMDSNAHYKSGLFWVDESAYYCDASGAMQTGWIRLTDEKEPEYPGGWYYFDANGAWLVRSDIEGCEHGVLTMFTNHEHLMENNGNIVWDVADNALRFKDMIEDGLNMWSSATDIFNIREGVNWTVLYEGNSKLEENEVAVTRYLIDGSIESYENVYKDYGASVVYINQNFSFRFNNTVAAHELGHAIGLSHHYDSRYGIRYPIMWPENREDREISTYDLNVVGHLHQY